MLRDENDFKTVSKAPIIILNPEKTLTVTKTTDITDELRKQSKATVKEYESMGKDWVKKIRIFINMMNLMILVYITLKI